MSGKGSRPRPFSVSDEEYASRWDAIFGRDVVPESSPSAEGRDQPKEEKPRDTFSEIKEGFEALEEQRKEEAK